MLVFKITREYYIHDVVSNVYIVHTRDVILQAIDRDE